jgi:hypothetical protein
VLIYVVCKYVVKLTTISRHLADKHKMAIKLRKEVEEYVREFLFIYDHTTVLLPSDRSALQPIIPTIYSLKC